MLSGEPNIEDVTNFVLHIVYNRLHREKSLRESRYNLLKTKRKSNRKKEMKYNTSKDLPPDQSLLKMKIVQASFVTHCMSNCLNSRYVPLDPSLFGWKFVKNRWEPIWFEANSLPHPDYPVDESGEVDESGTAERPGKINESEIVESEEADFEKSGEISENYSDQKEHSDSSEYADSCSDSNEDTEIDFSLVYDTYSCLILIILFLTNDILKFLLH